MAYVLDNGENKSKGKYTLVTFVLKHSFLLLQFCKLYRLGKMYRKCILVCSFLLSLNGLFFSQGLNSVSTFDFSLPEKGADLIGDIYRGKIRTAIKAAADLFGSWKPLSLITALDETCTINQTLSSLDVRIITPETVSTMTGGIFGRDVYEFYKFSLYWQDTVCNETTHNLEARAYYVNMKYGSYENALDFLDGVVIINFPVATNGDFDNPKFEGLLKVMQKKIKEPGDSAIIHSSFTYLWFANFPYGSIYHSTRAKYVDEATKKKYSAVVVTLPLDQRVNYISREQFTKAFGRMKGVSQVASVGDFFQSDQLASMERHKGVCVLYLPA